MNDFERVFEQGMKVKGKEYFDDSKQTFTFQLNPIDSKINKRLPSNENQFSSPVRAAP